jgi:hypothetical protein
MHGVEHATPVIILLMLLLLGPVLLFIHWARSGRDLYVRRLPGVDAIDEACGRSAELGRPISFSTGLTGVNPVLYAVLGVLFYVGRKAARYKSQFLLPQYHPEVMAISEDVLRDAYRVEGRLAQYDPQCVRFLSEEQFAFAAGYMGMVQREQISTAFLFGSFAAESLLLAEAGQQVGAMQVAASVSPEQVPFFICTCDYTLIGEELFASAAYLTREPVQLGSLLGQDRAKLLFFVFIVIGVGIATWNTYWQFEDPARTLNNIDHYIYLDWGALKSSLFGQK